MVDVFRAPPVDGLGTAGGFKLMVEDRGDAGPAEPAGTDRHTRAKTASGSPASSACSPVYRSNTPQLYIDIDRTKVKSLGVSLNDVFHTLQVYLGSLYVNNFNVFGRSWQVNVQADAAVPQPHRGRRPAQGPQPCGQMVPLGTVAGIRESPAR